MTSDSAIRTVDFSFHWSDNGGNLFPIYIFPGQSASGKCLWRPRHEHVVVQSELSMQLEDKAKSIGGRFNEGPRPGKRKSPADLEFSRGGSKNPRLF